jgi:hypothetical protein
MLFKETECFTSKKKYNTAMYHLILLTFSQRCIEITFLQSLYILNSTKRLWRVMVLSTTFNNISVISWLSVLTGVPTENHRPAASHRQTMTKGDKQCRRCSIVFNLVIIRYKCRLICKCQYFDSFFFSISEIVMEVDID